MEETFTNTNNGGFDVPNKKRKTSTLARLVLMISIVLVPILFYPNNIHFFANLKLGLFFAAVLIALILWSISRFEKNDFKFPSNLLALSIGTVLLTTLLSAIFSENPFVSLFGVQLGVLPFAGILVLFVSSLLIGSLFKSEKNSLTLNFMVYLSMVITLFINLLYILLPFLPDFGFFVSNSINTVGKWSDLGVLSALVIILSYIIIETQSGNNLFKKIAWIGLVLSALVALIVSETIIWISLGILSIIYLVYKVVTIRKESSDSINKNLPYTAIAVILISFVMVLAGGLLSSFSDNWLNILYTETKPGLSSTFELSKEVIKEDPLLGAGTNRFERAWQTQKPESINTTNFWGTDFSYGYSYLLSYVAQTGLLGFLSWMFLIVMIVLNAIKLLFKKTEHAVAKKLNLLPVFSIMFFVIILLVHIPSVVILVYFFIFLGIFIATLDRNGLYRTVNISIEEKPKLGFLYIFSIIVLMIFSIYLGYMFSRQFSSTILLERANYNLNTGDLDGVRSNLVNSVNVYTTDVNLRALSEYYQIEINQLLNNQGVNEQAMVESFKSLLANAINASAAAISFDSNNYQNHVSLANIYEQLIQLGVEGSYDQAVASYQNAINVNPKNPGLHVSLARAAFYDQKYDQAKEEIGKALEMNPRFVDAAFLLSQIQVAEGNIDEAINSVNAAISIQPNNSNLYFQLGLLNYNNNDYDASVYAFERAVILQPFFANAKYFLGLSYDRVGRIDEAIAQFEDLKILNPDNQEVQAILDNLNSGFPALDGISTQPQERDELPIDETEEVEGVEFEEIETDITADEDTQVPE